MGCVKLRSKCKDDITSTEQYYQCQKCGLVGCWILELDTASCPLIFLTLFKEKCDILLMWIYIALVLSGDFAQCGAVNRCGWLSVLCHSCFIHKVFFTHHFCCHHASCLLCFILWTSLLVKLYYYYWPLIELSSSPSTYIIWLSTMTGSKKGNGILQTQKEL